MKHRKRRKRRITGRHSGIALIVLLGSFLLLGRLSGFGCAGRPSQVGSASVTADLMAGDWVGTWSSGKSDMSGALRCRIEKQADGVYLAHFDATFARVLSNKSSTTLKVQREGDAWAFTGEEDLGILKGGIYKYAGTTDGREFVCSYDSTFDQGVFRLTRPPSTTQPASH